MPESTFDTPAAAEAAFYAAFTSLDIERMAAVWTEDDAVICIHPGGDAIHGKMAVMRSWIEVFANADPPVVEHRLVNSYDAEGLVVHLVEELIRPRGRRHEKPTRVMATNIFVREGKGWKLAQHHASLPIVTRRQTSDEPARLH